MKAPFSLFLGFLLGIAEAVPRYRSSESVLRLPDSDSVDNYVTYTPTEFDGESFDTSLLEVDLLA